MDGTVTTLIWAIQQFSITQYCKVALITVFTADYFQTLATEITFLWPAPWTVLKAVFLVTRYSPFVDAAMFIFIITALTPSTEVCTQILRVNVWSSGIGQMSAQVLLIYRAYALLGQTRPSAIILSVFAIIVFATGFTLLALIHHHLSVLQSPLPGFLPGCLIASSSTAEDGYAIAGIIASIIYETILFLTICWAKFQKYKEDGNWLMKRIYSDALVYYLISLVISALGIIVWFSSTGPIRDLSSPVSRFLISIVSCRIILHIRKYGHEGLRVLNDSGAFGTINMVAGETVQSISGIEFAGPGQRRRVDTEIGLH
ncbi:hypothetical protein P691DRAFT_735880 [Macrolepiota fuliginosa MF-IS2]|uniref:DUF6533 domain-containing protein n=1 Tax=Macrolepiota fuliginosa MF-IS2 TaxID=1400762 RepID=A0A9P5X833_9AGAR|nr:hypothetical protein P691DRAFT_735880 [Macrolepiota fuliginosa MF-IS2]